MFEHPLSQVYEPAARGPAPEHKITRMARSLPFTWLIVVVEMDPATAVYILLFNA